MKHLAQSTFLLIIMGIILLPGNSTQAQELSAKEILKKAEDNWQGEESSVGSMTMKIVREKWNRTITMKNWIKGRDYALTLIQSPAKEKGQTFLKRGNEMWQWMPNINRMIKIPPSMMSQGWMGSDYTNDDILKESSIVVDYTHKILGEEQVDDYNCYKIELTPKENAAVVWGRVIKWISKEDFMQMKSEYYDEYGDLARTEIASEVQRMDGRNIPTHMEVIPNNKENQKTIIILNSMKFNQNIPDSFFSQQNMKRVR